MTLLRIGPEGLLLVWGLVASLAAALLAWRRAGLKTAAAVMVLVSGALALWQFRAVANWTGPVEELLGVSFIVAPSALLLGATRVRWLARRSWVLLLIGPIVFVGCYVGICECAYRLFGA